MNLMNPKFKYVPADQTSQPGYLQARMAEYQKKVQAEARRAQRTHRASHNGRQV